MKKKYPFFAQVWFSYMLTSHHVAASTVKTAWHSDKEILHLLL